MSEPKEFPPMMRAEEVWHWMDGDVHCLGVKVFDDCGEVVSNFCGMTGTAYLMQDRYSPRKFTYVNESRLTRYLGDNAPKAETANA